MRDRDGGRDCFSGFLVLNLESVANGGEVGLGEGDLLHVAVDRDVDGFSLGEKDGVECTVARGEEAVGEPDDGGAKAGDAGFDRDEVVVAGGGFVTAGGFNDGQVAVVLQLHLFVFEAELAEELDAADFGPDEVIGIVSDTHLVGFRIADAEGGDGRH